MVGCDERSPRSYAVLTAVECHGFRSNAVPHEWFDGVCLLPRIRRGTQEPPRLKPSIRINGVATAIAADILNGRVIAPARALTEALDGSIWYDPQRKALHIAHPRTGVHEVAIAEMRGSTAWARATDVVAACGATASWAAQNKVLNVNR